MKNNNLALLLIVMCVSAASLAQTFEAENGFLSGTQVSTQRSGYFGAGYVTGFDADGDRVTLTFNAQKGIYNLHMRYASPTGNKFNFVYVNGHNLGSVSFPESATFVERRIGKVYLNAGQNTFAVIKEWGYFDLDNIRIEPTSPSSYDNTASTLITLSPSVEAVSLYNFLSKTYGKVILSGQYGGSPELNRINQVAGKTPAIWGFDFMDYSPSRVQFGTSSTETEKAIAWYAQGGIVTFCWHWNAPKDLINTSGKEWWRGFYTNATTFDVAKAMRDGEGEERKLIIRDIDAIAVQLKRLKDANVPVLWRPLHEAEGKWFWWGAKGAEPCKWLWRFTWDRLVNHHGLNNLIWVWTSGTTPTALDWYPGDNYVDMIGADIYLNAGDYSSNFLPFDNLAEMFGGRKIIALSENGTIPDPDNLCAENAAWSWFATWSGEFITDGKINTASHLNAIFNHEYVITLDELDKVEEIIKELEAKRK